MTPKKRFFNALQIYIHMLLLAVCIVGLIKQNHTLVDSIILTIAFILNSTIYSIRNREKK